MPGDSSNASGRTSELSHELERALVRRLAAEWANFNWSLFKRSLRPPMLAIMDSTVRLGEWRGGDRTLSLSRRALFELPWIEVLEVLKHEMAHQFVDEVLGGEELPHGPLFQQVCAVRGIDAAATSRLSQEQASASEDRIIARVKKLLALAESSNQHEAELAASTAQRLILKFNIDLQARVGTDEQRYHYAQVGAPTGRTQPHQRELAALLLEHFFVDGIWIPAYLPDSGKSGHVLELCGRPENLQMALFVHDFVLQTVERLWNEHKRARAMRSNRDRRTFLTGAIAGFAAKLREKRVEAQSEGLVWVGDAGLDDYVRRRHPRLTSVRYSDPRGHEAYADGRAAGQTIVLSRPVTSTTDDPSRRRALPKASG